MLLEVAQVACSSAAQAANWCLRETLLMANFFKCSMQSVYGCAASLASDVVQLHFAKV